MHYEMKSFTSNLSRGLCLSFSRYTFLIKGLARYHQLPIQLGLRLSYEAYSLYSTSTVSKQIIAHTQHVPVHMVCIYSLLSNVAI